MASDKRRMVLFSGGGYHYRGHRGFLMDEWLLGLTGKAKPRVCLVTTPQGDKDAEFTACFKLLHSRADVTWAPMFNPLPEGEDAVENILAADLIYLPGGYAQGSVGALRAAGWDLPLRDAWEQGTLIAAMCAGAMTFCHQFANRWMHKPGFGEGLGLQPISFTAHAQHKLYEPLGSMFRHGIRDGILGPGYQLQDGFALRFAGTELVECVTTEPADATGWYLEPTDDAEQQLVEHELYAESLEARLRLGAVEDFDAEMRELPARERRARLRRPLEPRRRPLDGPVEVTSSIASPVDEHLGSVTLPDDADAPADVDVAA